MFSKLGWGRARKTVSPCSPWESSCGSLTLPAHVPKVNKSLFKLLLLCWVSDWLTGRTTSPAVELQLPQPPQLSQSHRFSKPDVMGAPLPNADPLGQASGVYHFPTRCLTPFHLQTGFGEGLDPHHLCLCPLYPSQCSLLFVVHCGRPLLPAFSSFSVLH